MTIQSARTPVWTPTNTTMELASSKVHMFAAHPEYKVSSRLSLICQWPSKMSEGHLMLKKSI